MSGLPRNSLASFAIRSSFVETVGECDASPIVPPIGPDLPAPPFAPRGPSGWFPHFDAPTAALRLLVAPRALVFLAHAVPADISGGDEISWVPGQPLADVPTFPIPVEPARQGPGRSPCVFPRRCCLPPR